MQTYLVTSQVKGPQMKSKLDLFNIQMLSLFWLGFFLLMDKDIIMRMLLHFFQVKKVKKEQSKLLISPAVLLMSKDIHTKGN